MVYGTQQYIIDDGGWTTVWNLIHNMCSSHGRSFNIYRALKESSLIQELLVHAVCYTDSLCGILIIVAKFMCGPLNSDSQCLS